MRANIPSFGAYNTTLPKKGAKFIPLNLDFTGGVTSREFDLVVDQMIDVLEFVQGVYIDNSTSLQPIYFTVSNSQQVIKLNPGWQGYFPLLAPNPPRIRVQSAGNTVIPIILYNVPLPASAWPSGVSAGFNFDANGALVVTDAALEALITDLGSGNALDVNIFTGPSYAAPSDAYANPALIAFMASLGMQWNGTNWERQQGNTEGTAISSASRASGTTTNSADLIVRNAKSVNVITNITTAGAGTVTVKVQVKDPVSNNYVDIPGAVTTALTGVSTNLMQVGPGLQLTANLSIPALLGRTVRISQTTGGGVNTTNSVGYQFIQ